MNNKEISDTRREMLQSLLDLGYSMSEAKEYLKNRGYPEPEHLIKLDNPSQDD